MNSFYIIAHIVQKRFNKQKCLVQTALVDTKNLPSLNPV